MLSVSSGFVLSYRNVVVLFQVALLTNNFYIDRSKSRTAVMETEGLFDAVSSWVFFRKFIGSIVSKRFSIIFCFLTQVSRNWCLTCNILKSNANDLLELTTDLGVVLNLIRLFQEL